MTEYCFENCDDSADEDDPDRAFKPLCVGIANATKYRLSVETHTESSVPDVTPGEHQTMIRLH